MKMEQLGQQAGQEAVPGLPWLPPQVLACSLRSQLNVSAPWGGGQVQSWMLSPGSPLLIAQLCLWEASASAPLLNLTSGNSALFTLAGSLDVSSGHWRRLVQYKVNAGAHWNRVPNAAEAVLRRLLRETAHHNKVLVIAVKTMQEVSLLTVSNGMPVFAFQRLAALALAGRCEVHISWAQRPLSRADRPPR